jgi:hypothetical protein
LEDNSSFWDILNKYIYLIYIKHKKCK